MDGSNLSDKKARLCKATIQGNLAEVKSIINSGFDINSTINSRNSQTALFIASVNGYTNIIDFLLTKGADINLVEPEFGCTPLLVSVIHQESNAIKLLIKRGADVAVKDKKNSMDAIDHAMDMGDIGIVRQLYRCGGLGRYSPIDAIMDNSSKDVKEFLETANQLEQSVHTTLDNLYNNQYDKMSEVFFTSADEAKEKKKLMEDQQETNKKACLALMDDVAVNARDKDYNTLLHKFAKTGFKEAAEKIISRPGIEINARNKKYITPLRFALMYGNPEVAAILIKHGAVISCNELDYFSDKKEEYHNNIKNTIELLMRDARAITVVKPLCRQDASAVTDNPSTTAKVKLNNTNILAVMFGSYHNIQRNITSYLLPEIIIDEKLILHLIKNSNLNRDVMQANKTSPAIDHKEKRLLFFDSLYSAYGNKIVGMKFWEDAKLYTSQFLKNNTAMNVASKDPRMVHNVNYIKTIKAEKNIHTPDNDFIYAFNIVDKTKKINNSFMFSIMWPLAKECMTTSSYGKIGNDKSTKEHIFILAAKYGHCSAVDALLNNEQFTSHDAIDAQCKDTSGKTALALAKQNGHADVIKTIEDWQNKTQNVELKSVKLKK